MNIKALLDDLVTPDSTWPTSDQEVMIDRCVFTLILSLRTAMAPIGPALADPIAEMLKVGFRYVAGGIVIVLTSVASSTVPTIRLDLL